MLFDRKYASFNKTNRKLVLSRQIYSFSHMALNTIFMVTTLKCQPLPHTGFLSSRSTEPATWHLFHKHLKLSIFKNKSPYPTKFLFYFVSQKSDSHSHSFSPFSKFIKLPDAFSFLSLVSPGNIVSSGKRLETTLVSMGKKTS